MPIRLLAIDLDGTLLTKERVPHPDNVRAIRRAIESGITVVPASGRIADSIRQFSDALCLDGAMICCNGAHVFGEDGGELLHVGLASQAVDITVDYVERSGVHVNVYTRKTMYFLGESEFGEMYRRRVRAVIPELTTADRVRAMPLLKLILIDHASEVPQHRIALEAILEPSIAALTESEPEYLEVLSPSANKGLALKALSESMGIRQEETAAIGDYLNDVEMVQWAGLGAAMANAAAEVKSAADMTVPSNDEAGVAWFIDHILEMNARGS